ncbi:hypothetical protein NC652_035748 [Populus alba x Populus x berolinensis]|nr:hypothetical protein NC652_035748 [Populus alba x Populus x berolinensis]
MAEGDTVGKANGATLHRPHQQPHPQAGNHAQRLRFPRRQKRLTAYRNTHNAKPPTILSVPWVLIQTSGMPVAVPRQRRTITRNLVGTQPAALWVGGRELLVTFTFDALLLLGSITIIFFAKEGKDCVLTPSKAYLPPVTVNFPQGLGQKFRQPSGTGIDFTLFEGKELLQKGEMDAFPLAVKARHPLQIIMEQKETKCLEL